MLNAQDFGASHQYLNGAQGKIRTQILELSGTFKLNSAYSQYGWHGSHYVCLAAEGPHGRFLENATKTLLT